MFALPGRLLGSQSGWIVEVSTEAAKATGVLAPLAVLFTGLPAGSYSARVDAAAFGAGYFVFFLYSALLGVAGIVLTILHRAPITGLRDDDVDPAASPRSARDGASARS